MRFLLGAAILLAASTPAFAHDHSWHQNWSGGWHCKDDWHHDFQPKGSPAPDLAAGIPAILAVIGAFGATRFVSKKR